MKLRLHFVVVVKSIDTGAYLLAQKADAVLSRENRHGTREEYRCDDRTLEEHPEWLIKHYIEHGGAVWAAKALRHRYMKDFEIPVHVYLLERVREMIRYFKKLPVKELVKPKRVVRRISLIINTALVTKSGSEVLFRTWSVMP